ncbi:MAG: hypothetical protein ACTSRE_00845 [Promethearchaeota archaeon]
MDSFELLPNAPITSEKGELSQKFLNLGFSTFKEACLYVHNLKYGYNSDKDDKWILFKEKKGSCTTKHGVIAALAQELEISLHKHVGVYQFTEVICEGAGIITEKHNIPYVPMVHCFLVYKNYRFDLTEGNFNGKKTSIEEFIHEEQVIPFITRKNEYTLYKDIVKKFVLPLEEMKGLKKHTILKSREEAIILLHKNIEK